ncbi:lipase maturation factor family protein [Agromyces salentinus]|uniref:Lipase maturation factor family protein n=1 Tax=Agromyces salentinus TaxID=269421 RepID=A0ABP4YSH9_9MICO|nr:lipase maturation factor family protein [Agromyces salentinus]
MDWFGWFDARDYEVAREVLQRGVAALALVAFISTLNQFRPLLGEHGLLPVPDLLRRASRLRGPSVFRWGYTDRRLIVVAATGAVLAASVVLGLPQLGPPWVPLVVLLATWLLYLSIVNVGQTFYGFGWEMLLCEALFTVALLGSQQVPPPLTIIVAVWWLVFRLEFGAGMIKIRGGREWRDLTALMYHHETQPMPGPLSRQAHLLPPWFHRAEVLGNHVAQLVVPFLQFVPWIGPVPVGAIASAVVILTQLWLIVTGNFAWLNWITVVLAAAAIPDSVWHAMLPVIPTEIAAGGGADAASSPLWWVVVVLGASALLLVLSWRPLVNLVSRQQLMNASFNRWMLVNAYGAFGTVTKRRIEIVVEGTATEVPGGEGGVELDEDWHEYGFKGKPGDVRAIPRQWAPYHLRLDWLMWFLPLGRLWEPWFEMFLLRLLQADAATLRLLAHDPFDGRAPARVRVRAYHYRFATRSEYREHRVRWMRTLEGEVMPPAALR